MNPLAAILRQRCPRCRQGKIFRRGLQTYEYCSVCLLRFEREQGYFLGAMYFSYFMSIGPLLLFFLLVRRWTRMSAGYAMITAGAVYLPLVPFVVRYSRVLWIWWDRTVDPE